jgi:hypothetical protein
MILGFIVSKEGKLPDPKKPCHHLNIPNRFKYSMGWHSFTNVVIMVTIIKLTRKTKTFLWKEECKKALELIK